MFIRLFVPLLICSVAAAQAVTLRLRDIKTVYVAELGQSDEAKFLREKLITRLAESRLFTITDDSEKADAVLTGNTSFTTDKQTVIVDGTSNSSAHYSARVLLKLNSQDKQLLWTSELEGRAASFKDVANSISDSMVKTLKDAAKKRKP